MTLRLSKHHGLGNDFLVALGDEATIAPLSSDAARRLCDRHRGVGADGLLTGCLPGTGGADGTDGVDLVMVLHNADGSRAEMSGNGIRCLAQAEVRRRGVDRAVLRIATDGGLRTVTVEPGPSDDARTVIATVDMGAARLGPAPDRRPEPSPVAVLRETTLDLGNPHLVLLVDDLAAIDVGAEGPRHERGYDDGINVHFAAATAGRSDEIDLRTWERGAGVTEACGTGATAVARALHDWGLVGARVTVHMPGGDVSVAVADPMVLTGPATHVADIEVPA